MQNKPILVTGGAGYIGSHVILALHDYDYPIVVLDDLSAGNLEVVPSYCEFIQGNAGNSQLVTEIIKKHDIDAVMHFAGSIVVEESVHDPLKYYRNNTEVSRNLIQTCVEANVNNFIFSSTAAVYGNPKHVPITENETIAPVNPYGHSKAMTEQVLKDVSTSTDLRYIALRYFNVAGADPKGRSGQLTKQSTHLIKVACELALGKRENMCLFGNDYDTPDGTCIRDFIHISDLANAHIKALQYLLSERKSSVMNCGYGTGYSVKQVLDTLQEIVEKPLNIIQTDRRPGDPANLAADNTLLRSVTDWTPKFNDLKTILSDALAWEKKQLDK